MYTQCETLIVSWKREMSVDWLELNIPPKSQFFPERVDEASFMHMCMNTKPSIPAELCCPLASWVFTKFISAWSGELLPQQNGARTALLPFFSLNTGLRQYKLKIALLVSRGNLFYKFSAYRKMCLLGILSFQESCSFSFVLFYSLWSCVFRFSPWVMLCMEHSVHVFSLKVFNVF